MEASPGPAQRRRTREEVQEAVCAALVDLLAGQPFKDVTVDELARSAGLSRTAFYFYFRGKNEVLMAAADVAASGVYDEADRWWHGEGAPEQLVREALDGVSTVYRGNAPVMRAAVETATYDDEFKDFYEALIGRFVAATAEHLHRERAAGRLRPLEPAPVAEALVWMAERSNWAVQLRSGRETPGMVDALTSIWVHALYPD